MYIENIQQKEDGSFVIYKNGIPYHIPNSDGFIEEYNNLILYIKENNITVLPYEEQEINSILEDNKEDFIRHERNMLLQKADNRITRYKEQLELGITPDDTADTYKKLLEYKQYLRDITKDVNFPNIEIQKNII